MKLIPASDSSLLVVFGDTIAPDTQQRIFGLFYALQQRNVRIRNLHPGYVSLLIDFDPLAMSHAELVELIQAETGRRAAATRENSAVIEIPVCYDAELGPDLADVATHTKLPVDEVVRLHSCATYDVCFLGFTAGFAYLGGMPPALATPRLATPRRAVAAGSVGIAGVQTGIYPTETPGGWRLIGRTPVQMFNPLGQPPTRVQSGDTVRLDPINRVEFEQLCRERA